MPLYPAPETDLGVVARGAAEDEDRFSISRTGPMATKCTFLVPTGSTATHRHFPKCQIVGCIIPALLFDTNNAAMEDHLRDMYQFATTQLGNSRWIYQNPMITVLEVIHPINRQVSGLGLRGCSASRSPPRLSVSRRCAL